MAAVPAPTVVEHRRGTYRDSVTLMLASRAVRAVPGVSDAVVAMATPLNLDLLVDAGFVPPDGAGPGDLVVAIRAADAGAIDAARAALEAALAPARAPGGTAGGPPPARTVGAAARRAGTPGVALVSVPGPYAFVEAMDALEAGLHPMVFSDNVPVEQEVRLKDEAARRGLLVMGPDCGTSVVGGIGLGFANVTERGPVGIVAASGTGAQHLTCLLDHAGVGVSHVLGVGGRDLSRAVAGRSTLRAMEALSADPGTELVVVVSKPPDPDVAAAVRAGAGRLATPALLVLVGEEDLTAGAERVLRALGRDVPAWPRWLPEAPRARRGGWLRGLFCGGTLCYEAASVAAGALGPVRSNLAADPALRLPADLDAPGHLVIDFGDDRLTAGRPHPVLDPHPRAARLRREAADPRVGVVLLDVVLGHGADPDPAAVLAPAVAAALTGRGDLAVVVSLSGTRGDPQGLSAQAGALRAAGAEVYASNAEAVRRAAGLAGRE